MIYYEPTATHVSHVWPTYWSRVSHTYLAARAPNSLRYCERDRLSKHFWQHARMGLRGGVYETAYSAPYMYQPRYITVHTLNAVARVKSVRVMLQHDYRSRDRYVIAFTLWSRHACTAARSAFAPIRIAIGS